MFSDLNKALASPDTLGLIPGERLFALPVLWNMIQDSYQTTEKKDLLQCALDSLGQILRDPSSSRVKFYYLLLALNNLKQGKSLFPSICVFISIMEG